MSLKYSSFLNTYVNWTDEEIAVGKKFLKWEEITVNWEDLTLLWEDISILLEVAGVIRGGGSGATYKEYVKNNPWDQSKKQLEKELGEEKTKKFIKLICRVNGIDYEEVAEPNNKIKITTEHIEKVFNEAVKVGIKID